MSRSDFANSVKAELASTRLEVKCVNECNEPGKGEEDMVRSKKGKHGEEREQGSRGAGLLWGWCQPGARTNTTSANTANNDDWRYALLEHPAVRSKRAASRGPLMTSLVHVLH